MNGDKYKSIGISGSIASKLSRSVVESGKYNKAYDILPFLINDGINEKGVFAGVNVVPYGDNKPTTGTNPESEPICALMLVRMILDNCSNVNEAKALIDSTNVYCSGEHEYHLIIGDAKEQYFVEFIDNKALYLKVKPGNQVMTNFYLNGCNLEDIYNTTTKHGSGVERYNYLVQNLDSVNDMDGMINLLYNIRYTNMYLDDRMLSEFVGRYPRPFGDVTLKDIVNNPNRVLNVFAYAQKLYKTRSRSSAKTWTTRHSVVYDVQNLNLIVRVEEDIDNIYEFKL